MWYEATPRSVTIASTPLNETFRKPSAATFYPVKMVSAQQWVRGNVVLIGDACHAMHPARGQGMNIALRCIDDLVCALTSGGSEPERAALGRSARDYEARIAPSIRDIEKENHRQGLLMDEAASMPLATVHGFLQSIANDPTRLSAFRRELAGYGSEPSFKEVLNE